MIGLGFFGYSADIAKQWVITNSNHPAILETMSSECPCKSPILQKLTYKCLEKENELAALDNLIISLQRKLVVMKEENNAMSKQLEELAVEMQTMDEEETEYYSDRDGRFPR